MHWPFARLSALEPHAARTSVGTPVSHLNHNYKKAGVPRKVPVHYTTSGLNQTLIEKTTRKIQHFMQDNIVDDIARQL